MNAATGKEGPTERIVEDIIGEMQGLAALYPENNVRELLAIQVENRLKKFQSIDLDSMTQSELREWVRWTTSLEPLLERARAAVAAGRLFFHAGNLGQLTRTLTGQADQVAFRKYIKQLNHQGP